MATEQSAGIKTSEKFPIVGIGASAGGLAAFESFFSGMPADDTNMAFIIVQHLAPDYKSMLTELIQRYTPMKVYQAQDGMQVQANCTYVIPPNYDMAILNNTLMLLKPTQPHGQRLPIDFFFQSLAQDQHHNAIGIILSGTGHDGTNGIKAIKQEGGLVITQDPKFTEFDSMPKNAIATGLVDYELSPDAMMSKIIKHISLFPYTSPKIHMATQNSEILNKIFILIRNQTTHDFSMYKPSTIGRRIERRMMVNQIERIEDYYNYLQRTEKEVDALFNDILIGVTEFFRDKEAFTSLQNNIIPKLFSEKPSDQTIRVWVTGCSTGEEAYSIAILLMEYYETLNQHISIQIFATDIDATAIATARAGIYSDSIVENISPKRLKRYFNKNNDNTYRIHKNIRDLLVFSIHDIIKDPPFSKIDLISCRNLLIYLNVELQQKLISLFHYALNCDSFLFLGSSESIGELINLFDVIDPKSKLFRCKKNSFNTRQTIMHRLMPTKGQVITPQHIPKINVSEKLPLRELTEKAILEQIAPAAVLVNQDGDILYQHGRTGMYLELPAGETFTNNIFKMARDGLGHDLTLGLYKSKNQKKVAHINGVHVESNGHFIMVNLIIRPVNIGESFKPKQSLYLVIFEDSPYLDEYIDSNTAEYKENKPNTDQRIQSLQQELLLQKEFLQEANDKLATSNEELKSYNEEIQSMNEELQSTNEELETSKEELQSVNEELSTVNSELNMKVTDLSQSYNDMNNLLAGTGIGTVFVDLNLCILRFTPAATRIINLIKGDVGRPVGHIVSNLVGYSKLVVDTQNVLDTLIPKEIEVKTNNEQWFLMRIQPYRTTDNVIEGAVISFVEISEIVSIRIRLEESAKHLSRLATVVKDSSDAITVHDMNGKIIAWNPGAVKLYGWSENEALRMNIKDRIPEKLQDEDIHKLKQLSIAEVLETYKTQRINKDGDILNISITSTALVNKDGKIYAIATTERIPLVKKVDI